VSGNLFSNFAEKLAGKLFGPAGKLSVTAFGKHPGWDDHIYDLVVDSEALLAVRQYLYTDGIGSLIDSGEWEKTDPTQRIEKFNHAFFWFSPSDLIVGRMWSSTDGKGRSLYPMIICAHLSGGNNLHFAAPFLQQIERIELACRATLFADEVRIALDRGAASLLDLIQNTPPPPPKTSFAPVLADLRFDDSHEELLRACYGIQSQIGGKKTGKPHPQIDLKLDQLEFFPQHIRLPASPPQTSQTVLFWNHLIHRLVGKLDFPILILAPPNEKFIDVVVGRPGPQQLACLRENEAKIPCASLIPYNLTEEFKATASALLV